MGRGYYFFRFTLLLNSSHLHFHCLHAPKNVGGGGGQIYDYSTFICKFMKKVCCKKNCPLPDATCLSYFYKSLPRDNLPSSNTFFYPSYGLSFLFFSDAVTTVMIIKVVIYCYLWEFIQLIRCSVTCILKSVSKREKKIVDFFFKF